MRENISRSCKNIAEMFLPESSRVVEARQINNGDGVQKA